MASLFCDESDTGDIPDVNLRTVIQPYMYEPVRSNNNVNEVEESESDTESEAESSDDIDFSSASRLTSLDWCKCGNCSQMPTIQESKCCQETNIVDSKLEEAGITCITLHDGFVVNCLNIHVLETAYYEYLENNGPLDQNEQIHNVYRYLAYRRFVRWIYHILGKKQRQVLPSCAVKKIRDEFPAEHYKGFKYPA